MLDPFLVTLPPWLPGFVTVLILAATVYSFIREKLSPDLTGLLALLALLITGILTPQEAFSGFSHPATVSVAAALVLSAGLNRTGALAFVARRMLAPIGRSEFFLTFVLMALIASLSAFVNNTAVVAVFIPVVLELSRNTGVSASRLLMPMSLAATFGGMCTLIGTSTNLVGHSVARHAGFAGFGMFELGQVGFPMLIAGFIFLLFIGRFLLPKHESGLEALPSREGPYVSELVVKARSKWAHKRIKPETLQRDYDLELVEILREGRVMTDRSDQAQYEWGDHVRVRGPLKQVLAMAAREHLELHRPDAWKLSEAEEEPAPEPAEATVEAVAAAPAAEGAPAAASAASVAGGESEPATVEPKPPIPVIERPGQPLAEFVVLPGSPVVGRTLKGMRFSDRYGALVLGVHRPDAELSERPSTTPIRAGDVLVVEGGTSALQTLSRTPGFLLVGALERPDERPHKIWVALLTIVGVVAAVSVGLLPIVTAASAGCAVLMLTGCLTPREAYQAIDWRIIFLLAGALALAVALEKTGLTAGLAGSLASLTGVAGPYVVMAAFLITTSVASQLISNAGTVALLGPLAVSSALQMGMNPMPMLVAVTLGASISFATPIGYQTNLMIYGPGRYRFRDYIRVGLPLNVLMIVMALILIPRYWPLVSP